MGTYQKAQLIYSCGLTKPFLLGKKGIKAMAVAFGLTLNIDYSCYGSSNP